MDKKSYKKKDTILSKDKVYPLRINLCKSEIFHHKQLGVVFVNTESPPQEVIELGIVKCIKLGWVVHSNSYSILDWESFLNHANIITHPYLRYVLSLKYANQDLCPITKRSPRSINNWNQLRLQHQDVQKEWLMDRHSLTVTDQCFPVDLI